MIAGLVVASIFWLIIVIGTAFSFKEWERFNYPNLVFIAVCLLLTGGLIGSGIEWLIGVLA